MASHFTIGEIQVYAEGYAYSSLFPRLFNVVFIVLWEQ